MSIKKIENGKFKVNVYMGTGLSRYVAYATTEKEALILEQEAKLNKLKGIGTKSKEEYTFSEVFEIWWNKKYIISRHHEQVTINTVKNLFKHHILPNLGTLKIKKISFDILEDLQILWAFGDKKRNVKPYSDYRKLISYTKNVMKYAVLKGYIQTNPFDLLEIPVNENMRYKSEEIRKSKYYSVDDIYEVLNLMKVEYGFKAFVFMNLLYYLGASKGEIYALAWSDINLEQRSISLGHRLVKNVNTGHLERVSGMKNNYRFRIIPMNEEIFKMLSKWKALQRDELIKVGIEQNNEQLLFTQTTVNGKMNQPLHKKWINERLEKIAKKHKVINIKPHGLRHTFVSDMLNSGVDGLIIKSLVGHANTSNMIRDVYGHVNNNSKIVALETIEGHRKKS